MISWGRQAAVRGRRQSNDQIIVGLANACAGRYLATPLWSMHERLLDATTRVKEVREFPVCATGRVLKAEGQKLCQGCVGQPYTRRKVRLMLNAIRRFMREEDGASAAEYALLLAIIALGMVAAGTNLGTKVTAALQGAADKIVIP